MSRPRSQRSTTRSSSAEHGAFYCAEGQYVVANLGPQEDEKGGTLLKQSRYGDTPFGRLIANFIKAPGYAGMSAEERRKHPSIGWEYLVELGENNGGISNEQALILTATDRQGVALDFIDEDVKGWQAYRPKNKEALIARPMTVATLAWGLLRLYMPRDAVAKAIAADIARAYAARRRQREGIGQDLARREGPDERQRPGFARRLFCQGRDRAPARAAVERSGQGVAALQVGLHGHHRRCRQAARARRLRAVPRHSAKRRLFDASLARQGARGG